MKKLVTLSITAVSLMFLSTGCVNSYTENMEHSSHKDELHWGYKGETAPKHWGSLNEKFKVCSTGRMQTPINIIPTKDINLEPIKFEYKTGAENIINNGHTVQVNVKAGSYIEVDGKMYELKQFHFHTPSENNIKGKEFNLEIHFVHSTKDGKLAVVAVMLKEGKENPILKKIWSKFPLKLNKSVQIDLSANDINNLLPKNRDYYKFMGSLTTPPCTENVQWLVLKTALTISKGQTEKFYNVFGHSNNRPIQNTNGRAIFE